MFTSFLGPDAYGCLADVSEAPSKDAWSRLLGLVSLVVLLTVAIFLSVASEPVSSAFLTESGPPAPYRFEEDENCLDTIVDLLPD